MKRRLLDILACPIDKHYPLELIELNVNNDVIIDGVLVCSMCGRYYPIIDEIPVMLPDDLRDKNEDLEFLRKWAGRLPERIVYHGKPYHLERKQ
ncbi:MAG: Trm112 family protein [Nitrososphaerota archaeon]|nr:Trm112 family protein [Nitrososphaerales archaeon]MDW8044830.1 Trm112 family protein [Nitrososphaerota archaeon]